MQKHLNFVAGSLLAALVATSAIAQDDTDAPTAATVVATVNGQDITLGHIIAARATLPDEYQSIPAETLYQGILDQLIQQTALSQSFTSDLPPRVTLLLENEERSLRAGEAIEEQLAGTVTDEDIQSAYDAQYGSIDPQEEFNASHILVETEEIAQAIKEKIDGGADFGATAREESTGPSGPNGGNLGWFGTGMMVPEFEAAVIALSPGEVSDPVQTQFGWHVIILNETRKAAIPALDDVRDQITADLRSAEIARIIEESTASAEILVPEGLELDPALSAQTELLE